MKKLSLVGHKYGRLTVVGEGKKRGRVIYWLCQCECGNTIETAACSLRGGKTKSCGCYRRETTARLKHDKIGPDSPNWRGGRRLDKDGYVIVWVGKRKIKREHVLVMEQLLGRDLLPDETVHHKNGIRSDNAIGNLELRASNHGRGQTASDLLAWAKEIIRRYDGVKGI